MTQSFNFNELLAKSGATDDNTVPPDEYQVTVIEADAVVAGSGNPMLKVKFSINGGPHDGRWVFNNFVLAINSDKGDSALKPFFRQMRTFGLDDDFFKTVTTLEQVAPLLVGKAVTIKTAIREYNGTNYTDVKSVSSPKAVTGAAPLIPALGGGGPATPPPAPATPPPVAPATPPATPATPPPSPF